MTEAFFNTRRAVRTAYERQQESREESRGDWFKGVNKDFIGAIAGGGEAFNDFAGLRWAGELYDDTRMDMERAAC